MTMQSLPEYPHKHSGTAILVGSAANVKDDLNAIVKFRPGAMYAGINEGAGVGPVAFIMSMHGERMDEFRKLRLFYDNRFTTHAVMGHSVGEHDFGKYPVDYWWDAHSGASSAASGVMILKMMGFDEVILCGCPLTGGDGYYRVTQGSTPDMKRLGFELPNSSLIKSYQTNFKNYAQRDEFKNVYSMSGFTASVLGMPPDYERMAYGNRH